MQWEVLCVSYTAHIKFEDNCYTHGHCLTPDHPPFPTHDELLMPYALLQVLQGLDYLHRECGLIHTDLKPENVMLKQPLRPRLPAAQPLPQTAHVQVAASHPVRLPLISLIGGAFRCGMIQQCSVDTWSRPGRPMLPVMNSFHRCRPGLS